MHNEDWFRWFLEESIGEWGNWLNYRYDASYTYTYSYPYANANSNSNSNSDSHPNPNLQEMALQP